MASYYQLEDFYADVRSPQQPRIPLYFGGSSDAAYRVGGKHADVYALWGEPLAETAEQIASVRQSAAASGRSDMPGISVSFRPILGPTEDLAWERAHQHPGDDPKQHQLFRESVAKAVVWLGWLRTPKRRVAATAGRGGERGASRPSPLDSSGSRHGRSRKLRVAAALPTAQLVEPPLGGKRVG